MDYKKSSNSMNDQPTKNFNILKTNESHPRLALLDKNIPLKIKQHCTSTANGKENQGEFLLQEEESSLKKAKSKGINSKLKCNTHNTTKEDTNTFSLEYELLSKHNNATIEYLQATEQEISMNHLIKAAYAENHAVLTNWLIRVQNRLNLSGCALFAAVNMMDLFFCKFKVPATNQQLVACTALWIAAKLESRYDVPSLSDFVLLSKSKVYSSDILLMEIKLLKNFGFKINFVSPLPFVCYYLHALNIKDMFVFHTCNYLLDIIYLDLNYSTKRPSLLAAASVYAALVIYNKTELWKEKKIKEFNEQRDVLSIALTMLNRLKLNTIESGAYKKYDSLKYNKLSFKLHNWSVFFVM